MAVRLLIKLLRNLFQGPWAMGVPVSSSGQSREHGGLQAERPAQCGLSQGVLQESDQTSRSCASSSDAQSPLKRAPKLNTNGSVQTGRAPGLRVLRKSSLLHVCSRTHSLRSRGIHRMVELRALLRSARSTLPRCAADRPASHSLPNPRLDNAVRRRYP